MNDGFHRLIGNGKYELLGVFVDWNLFLERNMVDDVHEVRRLKRINRGDGQSRLQAFNYFLNIATRRDKMHIVTEFVHEIPKHLLTLLIDKVNVVQHDELFLPRDVRTCLAKSFDVRAKIMNPLFFQTIDVKYIFLVLFWTIVLVIFTNQCVQNRRFSRSDISHKEQLNVIDVYQHGKHLKHFFVLCKIMKKQWLVFIDKEVCRRHMNHT